MHVRYEKSECYFFHLTFLFHFLLIYFSTLELRVRVRVTSQLCCHTSVTSYDIVTVIVTSHEVTEKNIEGSRRMILYTY